MRGLHFIFGKIPGWDFLKTFAKEKNKEVI